MNKTYGKFTIDGNFAEGVVVDVENILAKGTQVSDGYHTFDELYNHRITLYIVLCRQLRYAQFLELANNPFTPIDKIWRSKYHSDGELCFGTGTQFVMGIGTEKSKQITYHIPVERWDETNFADTLDKAPEWDEHTSDDVLKRLQLL